MNNEAILKVREIANFIYYKHVPSQLLIDLVEEAEELLDNLDETLTQDDLGSFSYKLDVIIEIFNPALEVDLECLKNLKTAIKTAKTTFISTH